MRIENEQVYFGSILGSCKVRMENEQVYFVSILESSKLTLVSTNNYLS